MMQGDPRLARPAMDAVRQWKYRPTLLYGVPVKVETQVALKF
ncbi:MAG: energy transducer TonB [Acidobacteria bacterium]|nr:energy transducer TonB [Acidobacteriota bacterium]